MFILRILLVYFFYNYKGPKVVIADFSASCGSTIVSQALAKILEEYYTRKKDKG